MCTSSMKESSLEKDDIKGKDCEKKKIVVFKIAYVPNIFFGTQ